MHQYNIFFFIFLNLFFTSSYQNNLKIQKKKKNFSTTNTISLLLG